MSKSLGNFYTIRDVCEKFGADATRIALADAGDSIEDANFSLDVAENAILKLYTLEQWIREISESLEKNCLREEKGDEMT